MSERIFASIGEMFKYLAPDLLEFFDYDDIFWNKVRENTITDEELDRYQSMMEELGIFNQESAVAKAIQILKSSRKNIIELPPR